MNEDTPNIESENDEDVEAHLKKEAIAGAAAAAAIFAGTAQARPVDPGTGTVDQALPAQSQAAQPRKASPKVKPQHRQVVKPSSRKPPADYEL